jgi:hypothetical protein
MAATTLEKAGKRIFGVNLSECRTPPAPLAASVLRRTNILETGANMAGTAPGECPRVLDGMSELMVFSNYPESKNIMAFGFDLEGTVDIDVMNSVLRSVLDDFWEFGSGVKESRINGERRLTWFRDPDFQPRLQLSDLQPSDLSLPFPDELLLHLDACLEKDWDLLSTVPTEFHLIRLPDGGYTLLTLVHHAAADGWTLAAFYRKLFAQYHEKITGEAPEWALQHNHASSGKNRMVELEQLKMADALFFADNSLSRYFSKPALPKGSGKRKEVGVHYVKSVLTAEETNRISANVSAIGSPFTDALFGGLGTAVDKWNSSRNVPLGNLVICVTVQMRGRYGAVECASNSSSIIVKLRPGDRASPELFSRSIATRRQEQLDTLADVRVLQAGYSLVDAMRALPLWAKRRIAHFVCQMPMIPVLIAPFGIMWPEVQDGRRTGDSYLKTAGGLLLNEFHAIPYKLGYRCPLILGAYTFRKRLNLQLIASKSLFTKAEAADFMNLLSTALIENPFAGAHF